MRSQKIEEILQKHGIEQSDKLASALEEILKAYSKDSDNIKTIQNEMDRNLMKVNRARGIR